MSFVRSGNRKRTPPRRRSTRGSIRDSLDSNYSNLVDRFNDKNGTFNMSMSSSRRSVLSDNTDIEEPRSKYDFYVIVSHITYILTTTNFTQLCHRKHFLPHSC